MTKKLTKKLCMTLVVIFVVLIAGCVRNNGNGGTKVNLNETEQKLVNLAKVDLANTLQITIDDIKLSKIEKITWPDSSLGYKRPGESYMPVEIPGYIILLSYNGIEYEYHSDYEKVIAIPKNAK